LMFGMRPWFANAPPQLGGARVASVIDPISVSRAWALQVLLDAPATRGHPPFAPEWVQHNAPWLARLWGDGPIRSRPLAISQPVLEWSRSDPDGLLAAARHIADKRSIEEDANARRLMQLLTNDPNPKSLRRFYTEELLQARPEALVEAVQILNSHRDEVARALLRYGYTDPNTNGGYLDRDLPNPLLDGN
jgi:hypothetical protein